MTKNELIQTFEEAKLQQADYISVFIDMPDLPEYEEIVNPFANFDKKLEYYLKAYNDNLELITYPKIKISGITFMSEVPDENDLSPLLKPVKRKCNNDNI